MQLEVAGGSVQGSVGGSIVHAACGASHSCDTAEQQSLLHGSCQCRRRQQLMQASRLRGMHCPNGGGCLLLQPSIVQNAARMQEASKG